MIKPLLAALAMVAITAVLFGCKKPASSLPELSFKSIDQGYSIYQGYKLSPENGYGSDKKEPGIVVITDIDEVENPGTDVQLSMDLVDKLRTVDYKKNFGVIVIRGLLQGTSPKYSVDILRVIREGDTVTIQAHFGETGPHDVIQQAFSSPYHIIRVTKAGEWDRDIHFVLDADGKEVANTTHFIPLISVLPSLSTPSKAASSEKVTVQSGSPSRNIGQNNPAEEQIALDYVSKKYDIPVDQLMILNEIQLEYAELGRSFIAFAVYDQKSQQTFKLAVDRKDGSVVDDISSLQKAVDEANQAKYGKLEPALYERLGLGTDHEVADDEQIEVAIWIVYGPVRDDLELYAVLADQFPEAKAAMEKWGRPFDVDDPEVEAKIEQAYFAMKLADVQAYVQPVVDSLRQQGYQLKTYPGMPSVTGELTKREILDIAKRPDIGKIFLIEYKLQPLH